MDLKKGKTRCGLINAFGFNLLEASVILFKFIKALY